MIKHLVIIWFLFSCVTFTVKANSDSTSSKTFRLKGVDFRYGFGRYSIADKDETALAVKFANDQHNYYSFDQAKPVDTRSRGISDMYVGMVLVPGYYVKNRLFYKEEFRLGVSFTILNNASNVNLLWDTIHAGGQQEVRNFFYQYKYNSQRIHFSYILNSRIIKQQFAFYAGIGGSVGFSTWRTNYNGGAGNYKKQVLTNQNNQISDKTQALPLENFSTGSGSIYVPIGLKYNVSCEINLFAEAHLGYQYYLKGLSKDNRWISNVMFNIGFRYKLIEDSDRPNTENHIFW
ncbi:MAG: hypothetical protein V4613_05285 [Bacteroidota bacterium]